MSPAAAAATERTEPWRRFRTNPLALFGLVLLTLLAGLALPATSLPDVVLSDSYTLLLKARLLDEAVERGEADEVVAMQTVTGCTATTASASSRTWFRNAGS